MLRFSLFVASSMMVASTSTAGGISLCPVDTLPIQIVNETSSGSVTSLSAAKISDSNPHFRAFVTAVTEHVAAQLAKEKLCINSAESMKRSLLQFVNWPLASSEKMLFSSAPSLEVRPTIGCRISSPWIDIVFERQPVPWIRSVIRWNQRQLLADQALLAGAYRVQPGLATPLKSSEFSAFAQDYANSEILGEPAARPIEERIPPDLLWLFSRAWQSTRGPFEDTARGSMNIAMGKGSERYTKLVIALVNRCFVPGKVDIRYSNILDVADLISLDQYKIETPIR